jgi:4-amino-4-deoxy-L-arabinose transferase-like glycosyltransferase
VSSLLGLGDAEALYYCYSRHLQASYLDHPPLIGFLIRLSTSIFGPSVIGVRLVPMMMTALCLLFSFLSTKDMFGSKAAAVCVLLMFSSPVFSIGMTAASPDAPLAAVVMFFTWQMHRALSSTNKGFNATMCRPLLLGTLLGVAFLAKYTGVCLVVSTLILLYQKDHRHHFRGFGFYLSAAIALLCSIPIFVWNARHDWVGVVHRLVYSQTEAGFSFRNIGALIGGQLLYVGPFVIVLFAFAIHMRNKTTINSNTQIANLILLSISLPTLALTYLLVAWSKTAEPHWPAMGYLPLFPLAANAVVHGSKFVRHLFHWALGFGIATFLIAHIFVLTPVVPILIPSPVYEPKYDLANELRGFPELAETIRRIDKDRRPVVAAFYTQCAQLSFHLNHDSDPKVRCASPEIDDFDLWFGSFIPDANGFIFIADNRIDRPVKSLFSTVTIRSKTQLYIRRSGVTVRRFEIFELNSR